MEIFSNLLWVAVAITLCALWITGLRRPRTDVSLPPIGMQLAGLALLAAILLPVISLTDDLQAITNPAETERVCRCGDPQPHLDRPLHHPPVALTPLVAPRVFPAMAAAGFVAAAEPVSQLARGSCQAFTTRPPPAV